MKIDDIINKYSPISTNPREGFTVNEQKAFLLIFVGGITVIIFFICLDIMVGL